MKKEQDRCMACKKVISNKRYYCYGCFQVLEEKVGGIRFKGEEEE